jgi:GDP-mannose 6-dehydrogenase
MLKYTCNAYHALKVAFANEVGVLARAVGVDSHALMQVFCQDSKLNISKAYLEPGFAFGGSCLPKDLRAMLYRAKELDLKLPVLEAVLPSNELHVARAFDLVMGLGRKRIGILGLSFKANTDDLRESPILTLVKALIGEGCQLRIYDPHVKLSALVGANRQFLEETIPHIGMLLEASLEAVLRDSEVIVVSRDGQELRSLSNAVRPDQVVVELVRCRNLETGNARLIGLAR